MRRLAGGIAVAAVGVASLAGAPHDIAYFNELAGSEPAAYLSDSNLDWGQDAWRLKAWWDASGRPPIVTNYFGSLPLETYGIRSVGPHSEPAQYLVISVGKVTASARWLLRIPPARRVGSSIWI